MHSRVEAQVGPGPPDSMRIRGTPECAEETGLREPTVLWHTGSQPARKAKDRPRASLQGKA